MPISVKIPVLSLVLIALLAGSAGAQSQLVGDLNQDYKVDFKDLRTLAWQWLDPACLEPGCPADIDGSDGVNMVDYALLAKSWQMEQTHLIISEFMASNASQIPLEDGELLDGNGESSDWIEIYNPTSATVSLDGWYLTDNDSNLTKWQFPDGLELAHGEFLVVFASNKTYDLYPSNYPYLDTAGYYHTNFELNQAGDYLALVAPGGTTVVHEYADEFPRQLTDISYGLTQYATTFIPSGADVSFHVPTSGDSGADWTNLSFDDSSWDTGKTGLGFGIGGTQTVAYNDSHRYVGDFTAANVTNWTIHNNDTSHNTGKLKDFATGSEVGMPTVTFTMGSQGLAVSTSAGGNPAAGTDAYEIFNNIVDLSGYLVYYGSPGWWVEIEFTGLNPASMYSFAGTAIRASDYPNRKSLFTIMGHNGAVNNSSDGVILKTDNTTIMLAGDNRATGYAVRWDGIIPALDGSFKVRAEATADSEDGRAYPLGAFMLEGGGGDSELQDDMLGVNASLWSRIKFNVIDPGDFDTLTLRMRYEDGFVAYLNGEKVASGNAPNPAEWNSTALSDRPNENSLVFEEFNLMTFLHLLQPGVNVLAIQGLNDNKDNGDFFILPELVAARNRPVPQYFTTPTPGTFNVAGAIGLVEEVWFSHARGFYDAPFPLTLSTATKDAEIRYTTDSSTPTITHGNTYSSPILIDKITTLRAVAVKPGWLDSDVETHSYYFLDDVITQATDPVTGAQIVPDGYPTMWISGVDVVTGNYQVDPDVVGQDGTDIFGGLYANTIRNDLKSAPTISMVMDKDDWFGDTGIYVNENQDGTERVASFEFVNPSTGESFQVNCAIAMQGGVSGGGTSLDRWKVYKLSMRPRFKDSTDDGLPTGGPRKLDYKFFSDSPIEHYDTIVLDAVLNNAWNHSSQHATAIYIQDQCVGDFHNAMGGYSPHGYYAHVYINELYWGMYYIHERPDHSWAAETFGGEKEEYDAIKHNAGLVINDGGGIGSGTASSNFYAMTGAADDVQLYPTDPDIYNILCEMLDIDNFITYILSHWYAVNWDWPSKNWYATHRHPVGKWRFHTWDAEHSLEWYNTQTVRGLSPYSIHDKLKGNPEYKMRFADIVHKAMYNDGPLTSTGAPQIVQNRMNQVDRPIVGESARWGDTRVSIPHTREDLFNNLNSVLTGFISPRWTFMNDWLKSVGLYPNVAAPAFRINGTYQHGGEASAGDALTMDTPPSGTIYYTTDGSDPREPWTGNVLGTPYSPITLTKSMHVKARVRDGSTWSALNEATYAVGPVAESLRITEIMYHPKNTGNPSDPNKEFIELKNIGTSTLNLNLVRFTEGVDFTFPDMDLAPGTCVVVVRDQSAFESQYGTGVNTAGHYIGSLANDGERITLVDAIGRTILDFKYGDGWRPITDGDGFSLTIIDPTEQSLYGWEDGLVAHWKFDDGAGITAIDSAGTNNGTLIGDPTWTTGRIGGALNFDGAGDYVSVAPVAALAGVNFTAQAWVNLDASAGVWNSVLMQHNLSNDGCYFYVANDKPSFYLIEGGGVAQAISPETLNPDQWYHIAATNDGSDLKIYVDGQLKSSGSSVGLTGVSYDAYIGCEPVSLLYYTGLIDDVRIYNRAVSESEFQDTAEPMTRWSQKDSWRASVYRNGSPGWDDSGILPNPGAIVINEVMSHSNTGPDWIELYNTTDDPINIGGWFLSDNSRDEPNLMKYRIANGTIINDNSYLVFYQDMNFNNPSDPGCLVPFALSENGEKVSLSSHLDLSVMLTGYREVEDFGPSATNVSFGRYSKISTGNFNFVAMDYNTPDSNNAYPRVGPVVINEIMYNPASGNQKEEYIELHNITAAPYTLYRLDKLAPWKFTDGIDLTFSSSPPVTIPPLGYLLVVKDHVSFTARYGSIPGVQIVEDYDGWLSNSGERLQIGMPGDTDDEGTRQYIRIDRVTYSDGSHPEDVPGGVDLWPTGADGLGKSLSRKVPSDYGNDVANWQAATPSPGAANP